MSKDTAMQAVIEYLAADVIQLEAELVTYRQMAQQALAQCHELTKHNAALRQQIADRREEIRRYTANQLVSA